MEKYPLFFFSDHNVYISTQFIDPEKPFQEESMNEELI